MRAASARPGDHRPAPEEVPIVAQSCCSDWAEDAAVAVPVSWADVVYTTWRHDADTDDFVVTVMSWRGDWRKVHINAEIGCT